MESILLLYWHPCTQDKREMPMVKRSDLSVITKAKDLSSYILTITDKSPKKFRFTLVNFWQRSPNNNNDNNALVALPGNNVNNDNVNNENAVVPAWSYRQKNCPKQDIPYFKTKESHSFRRGGNHRMSFFPL